ncbi:hypothetical protein [Lysinibacillus fusiformis]|uniref:hypothetical protein n=1 Tax=Lysinibacillus fusiformis TaxID=28031 RepID=UPI00263B514C|nr:hypothetical protein [Lysinibacillus fusiformis]MDC6267284.1 hypothetical protein [Lysinibacillus sphaericus]MDN4968282.1 hypothetical protein [Lysinibacillus fusiformis]MDN4968456.1 hypothetical protein [Lysinibacillus fusiformis]
MFEHKLQPELNLNEVFQFMQEFKCDFINRFCEIIIDEPTNTYVSINECKSLDDIKARILMAMCRPIGKGLELTHANRLLDRFNTYFNTNLTREDMRKIYGDLCYSSKLEENKDFIKRGFPVHELKD